MPLEFDKIRVAKINTAYKQDKDAPIGSMPSATITTISIELADASESALKRLDQLSRQGGLNASFYKRQASMIPEDNEPPDDEAESLEDPCEGHHPLTCGHKGCAAQADAHPSDLFGDVEPHEFVPPSDVREATHHDADGIGLCDECWDALVAEDPDDNLTELDPPASDSAASDEGEEPEPDPITAPDGYTLEDVGIRCKECGRFHGQHSDVCETPDLCIDADTGEKLDPPCKAPPNQIIAECAAHGKLLQRQQPQAEAAGVEA